MYYILHFLFAVFTTNLNNYLYILLCFTFLQTVSSMKAQIMFDSFTILSPEPSLMNIVSGH